MPPTTFPTSPNVLIDQVETPWSGRYALQVVSFRNRRFDGAMSEPRRWELWRRGRAAAVLPYDPERDMVVLIEQFRLPAFAAGLEPVMVEIAAGMIDGDETPEATILRESQEEMGLHVESLVRVGGFLLTPGGCDEHCTIFAGRVRLGEIGPGGAIGHGGLASEQEDIAVRAVPADEAIEKAVAGAYPNSVATIALLWLGLRRGWLREQWI
jgi:ADP-ribose pyrophosphatase